LKTAIISGITGQDGAYLAEFLLKKNYRVIGLKRINSSSSLSGLTYLNILSKVTIIDCDLLELSEVIGIIEQFEPTEIYNLAAQSSVSISFKHPIETFKFNTLSVYNFLEAIKTVNKEIKFYQASSSEMFGKVNNLPITENSILHPLSPYAISKAAAHFTCVNYRESYDMKVSCGILFNHESYLRGHNFFVKKIIHQSIKIHYKKQDILEVGNIDTKRDFGYAPRYIEAMYLMLQQPGFSDYLICSGESVSLREIINYIFRKLDIDIKRCQPNEKLFRPAEILDMYGDNTKAKQELNWNYNLTFFDVLDKLLEEELLNFKL
jgi:GDPmannose 4,6-dehydratase